VFTFRIRFDISSPDSINIDSDREEVARISGQPVELVSSVEAKLIHQAERLSIRAAGFESERVALESGSVVMTAAQIALARQCVGADFGSRAPESKLTEHGLDAVSASEGRRCLNDRHGLCAFESEPPPRFIRFNAKLGRRIDPAILSRNLGALLKDSPSLDAGESVAFELFNSSFFERGPDGRFMLLMMAIEALIRPADRESQSVRVIESFIAQVRSSDIPSSDKQSIMGSLSYMKQESIGQAGRRMVQERLGGNKYSGKAAAKYFTDCYSLRSRLVHGHDPFPQADEIRQACATLEVFVSDLLTTPFLGPRLSERMHKK
jgi:hypothetical protein